MKNLAKFLLFVLLVSAGISLLYDYRLKRGNLDLLPRRASENYPFASEPAIEPKQVAALEALNEERRALVKRVIPSVVAVKTSKKIGIRRQYGLDPFEFFFGNPRGQFRSSREEALVQNSLGSGVIVTNEGHIITNNHVVDQVDEIEVQLSDGRTKKARLVGADSQIDLAVLKIDDPGVKPLKLADSDTVQAGDFVLAIGNPFGFEETVTEGIISSKGRPNRTDAFGDLLQTDAAVITGNSGGPLINFRGDVIGINTAIISRTGGSQGIGFAIPSNTIRTALDSLLKQGRIIRGYLGIQAQVNPQNLASNDDGVVVGDVLPGSPAADAQLQKGDVIRKFNGRDVKNFPELRSLVAQAELNKKIDLEVIRDGKPLKVSAELREQPPDNQTARAIPRPGQPNPSNPLPQPNAPDTRPDEDQSNTNPLGSIRVSELTADLAKRLDLPTGVRGVVVDTADLPELQRGDVIEEIDQQPVTSD